MPRMLYVYCFAAVCALFCVSCCSAGAPEVASGARKTIKAIYIPLADHYAGIVAYEKYRDQMQYADYQVEMIPGPALVRARFREEDADMAFNVCPMVMDMFAEKPDFRWVSLIHRDGNALAINEMLNQYHYSPKWKSSCGGSR